MSAKTIKLTVLNVLEVAAAVAALKPVELLLVPNPAALDPTLEEPTPVDPTPVEELLGNPVTVHKRFE